MKKNYQVHFLPSYSPEAGDNYIFKCYDNSVTIMEHGNDEDYSIWKPYTIYVTTFDEDIKQNDMYIFLKKNAVCKAEYDEEDLETINKLRESRHIAKIIASNEDLITTEPIQKLHESFISRFIREYRNGNMITEVPVRHRYKNRRISIGHMEKTIADRKVDEDNCIEIVLPIDRNYTYEDMLKAFDAGAKGIDKEGWIERTLEKSIKTIYCNASDCTCIKYKNNNEDENIGKLAKVREDSSWRYKGETFKIVSLYMTHPKELGTPLDGQREYRLCMKGTKSEKETGYQDTVIPEKDLEILD